MKSEQDYKRDVRDYLLSIPGEENIARGVQATKRCLREGKSWEWIATALKKKSVKNWETWGFGLLFHRNFEGAVNEQMQLNREAREMNAYSELHVMFDDCSLDDYPSGNDVF